MIPTEFIRRIPKTDLHLHLDGSLRIPTLIELAKKQRVKLPSYTEDGLRRLVFKDQYPNLPEYLKGFAYTCAVMQTIHLFQHQSSEVRPVGRSALDQSERRCSNGWKFARPSYNRLFEA